ncbi:MAG: hypothetical protein IKC48_03020 [Clostridia bacterium]|nr:hypothetical protein [Clostridia bacterium]
MKIMKDFIAEIRKIRTDELILELSKLSIQMFQSETRHMKNLPIQVNQFGIWKNKEVLLTAWDILNVEFLSIKNSNDYRDSKQKSSIGELINLYRGYENAQKDLEYLKDGSLNEVFRTVLGMTAEQFQYQNLDYFFERFNRNYYILVAADKFEHRDSLDVSAALENVFGYSVEDYLSIMLMVYWLCSKCPEPLSAPESVYKKTTATVFTKENITNFVKHYSCSYTDLRGSSLGKQLLYSKPFIKTDRSGKYIASSMLAVFMLIGNGLYWVVRDYYQKKGTQEFPNKFGLLFEDYIKDLASKYCKSNEWQVIEQGVEKGADFLFDFGDLRLLVEAKSALLKLDAKQQVPNLHSANQFFERNIEESYKQLNRSFEEFSKKGDLPIAKIILLYDEFSNTAIIEHSLFDVFQEDKKFFVMTIRQLEILLHLHKHNSDKFESVLQKIIDSMNSSSSKMNMDALYSELDINENPLFEGEMDYFQKQMQHFEMNLK